MFNYRKCIEYNTYMYCWVYVMPLKYLDKSERYLYSELDRVMSLDITGEAQECPLNSRVLASHAVVLSDPYFTSSQRHEYIHNRKGMNQLFHGTDRDGTPLGEKQVFFCFSWVISRL